MTAATCVALTDTLFCCVLGSCGEIDLEKQSIDFDIKTKIKYKSGMKWPQMDVRERERRNYHDFQIFFSALNSFRIFQKESSKHSCSSSTYNYLQRIRLRTNLSFGDGGKITRAQDYAQHIQWTLDKCISISTSRSQLGVSVRTVYQVNILSSQHISMSMSMLTEMSLGFLVKITSEII